MTPAPSDYSSKTLRRVAQSDLCAGCGACAALSDGAVSMIETDGGFLRPLQTAAVTDSQESAIDAACPGTGLALAPEGRQVHDLWGPIVSVGRGYATDDALRKNASSGGGLSAVLSYLLDSGEVEAVVQTRASTQNPVGNETVESQGGLDVYEAAGSRYAPSAPLANLYDALSRYEKIAFIGKPCDVAALRGMQSVDARLREQVVFALSFFCAGVPSLKGAEEVLTAMGVTPEDKVEAFRYRGDGWPGYARADLADGSSRKMSYADSWGNILSRRVQKRCKICADGIGSFADLVCADAWETDADGYPLFEERDGISLFVCRTPQGQALMERAMASGAIAVDPCDADVIDPMQPGQVRKRRYLFARLSAMRTLLRPIPDYQGFALLRNASAAGIKINLRQYAGMLLREVQFLLR
ncbi:MAG: Coenzyme F420 hydrogenase/dehydrogenase, beta subunit C-terminal domain [Pseudomonadota bacterium]